MTAPRYDRPDPAEFAPNYAGYISKVPDGDLVRGLEEQHEQTMALLSGVPEAKGSFAYAPGKWTLKQVVGHMMDDERIFAYRALSVARNDSRPLPGFDEKEYVQFAGFEARAWADLLAEYRVVREFTLALFGTFTPDVWLRRGNVNGYDASVRGLAFHLAGHELHHLRIVREKYLRLSSTP